MICKCNESWILLTANIVAYFITIENSLKNVEGFIDTDKISQVKIKVINVNTFTAIWVLAVDSSAVYTNQHI